MPEVAVLEHVGRVCAGGVAQLVAGGEGSQVVVGADLVEQAEHSLLAAGLPRMPWSAASPTAGTSRRATLARRPRRIVRKPVPKTLSSSMRMIGRAFLVVAPSDPTRDSRTG